MNRPVRTLAIGCLVLFGLLLVNLNYVQFIKAGDLNASDYNRRARDAECSRERGPILVDGESVARSVDSNDSLKYIRQYSEPRLYAHVTGYFSCIYGSTAVEASENPILSGSDERLFVNQIIDLVGNEQPEGGSVSLTLDPNAQRAAWDGLKGLPGKASGAVVALDPETGAILAMVSTPSYNPNVMATHDYDAAARAYRKLNAGDAQKLRNRGTQEIYPPGSTFKLVVAAAALSNGYSPDSTVQGGTALDLPQTDEDLNNEGGSDCGGEEISLTQALMVSCNVSFGDLGLKLGAQTLQEQAEKFGFNEEYMDELPMEESNFPTEMDEPSTALSSIGQYEVAATPLQMAMVTAGIANGGDVMRPYVVDRVRSPDLDIIEEADPTVLHQAISGEVADQLTQMMVDVVEAGTGDEAQIEGVPVGGKTGTANTTEDRPPYAWMTTFAPADEPEVAVAVFIQNADVPRDQISGGGLAGPIAKNVMEAVLE